MNALRPVPPGTVLLARNLMAAVWTLKLQQELLHIIRLLGPQTTADLLRYAMPAVDNLKFKAVQRAVTALHQASLLRRTRHGVADPAVWSLPEQPVPTRLPRRPVERRRAAPLAQPPSGSWWLNLDTDRRTFTRRLDDRWKA